MLIIPYVYFSKNLVLRIILYNKQQCYLVLERFFLQFKKEARYCRLVRKYSCSKYRYWVRMYFARINLNYCWLLNIRMFSWWFSNVGSNRRILFSEISPTSQQCSTCRCVLTTVHCTLRTSKLYNNANTTLNSLYLLMKY